MAEGDSSRVFRIILILGLLMVLVGALSEGDDAAWVSFSDTVQTGVQLPVFTDPRIQNYLVAILTPTTTNSNGTPNDTTNCKSGVASDSCTAPQVTGCPLWNYWLCVQTDDGDQSYVTLGTDPQLDDCSDGERCTRMPIQMEGQTLSTLLHPITSVVANVWCREITAPPQAVQTFATWQIDDNRENFTDPLSQYVVPLSSYFRCPSTERFEKVSVNLQLQGTPNRRFDSNGADIGDCGTFPSTPCSDSGIGTFNVRHYLDGWFGEIQITKVEVELYSNREPACTGFDIGCIAGQFFGEVLRGIQFVFNIFAFIAVSIFEIGKFVIVVVGLFLVGVASVVAFFFAIPGAPVIVQSLVSVLFISLLVALIYIVTGMFRGSPA